MRYTCKCGLSDVLYLSGSWTDENGNKFTIENDVLTIDGAGGDCGDFWHSYFYRYCVKQVVVKNVKSLNGTFSRCLALEEVELPDGLMVIGDETFSACEALKQIELPNGLESIGYKAFYATGLTSVTIPDSVKTLGEHVFANSKSLESVILGSGCENIPCDAFLDCWKLTNIILPEGIKTISDDAFHSCGFERIKLPNSVTFIGANIFGSNLTLKSINIPSGISELNEDAFYDTYVLEKVYIGIETMRIGKNAFGNADIFCRDIKDVYYAGTEEEWNNITDKGDNGRLFNATIHFNHVHSYDCSSDVIAPTCASQGYTVHECVCGDFTVDSFVGPHNTELENNEAATCTENGYSGDYVCKDCGKTVTKGAVIPATDHDYGAWKSNGEGMHSRICGNDSSHVETKECSGGTADCTHKAVCTSCGEEYGDVNPDNHTDEKEWSTKNEMQHEQTWKCCGAVEVALENHEWKDGVCEECGYVCLHTGGTATCTDKAKCEVCGEEYSEVNADNHTEEKEWSTKNETQHEQTWKCCGAVTVALENHEWENGVCTECGYVCTHTGGTATCTDKAKCEACDEEYGEVDAANHATLNHDEAKAATVEAEGNSEYWHCEECDKYFGDKDGKTEITLADTVIAKLEKEDIVPDEKDEAEAPQTGYKSHAVFWTSLLIISAVTAVGMILSCKKKKRFTK